MSDVPDYDPVAIRIRPAATVMLVDDRPDLRVLMLRRNSRSIFAADKWMFPGGAVDPEDHGAAAHCEGIDIVDADTQLEVSGTGLGHWVAAVREAFEEVGVLLARRRHEPRALDLTTGDHRRRFEEHRRAVDAGELAFAELLRGEGLVLSLSEVHYVARWITPLGPPRRYDTRFFVGRMPAGQAVEPDNKEAVHVEWLSPGDAVTRWQRDEMGMMTPTARMVASLAEFTTADEVLGAAASTDAFEAVRMPAGHAPGDRSLALLPGERGYTEGDYQTESGWMGLRRR